MPTTNRRKVLFLCTGNSCRSQMAEGLLRDLGGAEFEALSAGSHPAGFIHELAFAAMDRLGVSMEGQRSKRWEEFAGCPIDLVITLCDAAAAETCPDWPGSPFKAHWPLPDPTYHVGSPEDRIEFAVAVVQRLKSKIKALITLDWLADGAVLQERFRQLGEI